MAGVRTEAPGHFAARTPEVSLSCYAQFSEKLRRSLLIKHRRAGPRSASETVRQLGAPRLRSTRSRARRSRTAAGGSLRQACRTC
eukprot:4651097-Alexandrium_andersonii.AAC.1